MTQIDDRPAAPAKPPLEREDQILTAITKVMADVIGIAKAGEMRQGTGINARVQYNFQRYEDMAAAVGKAFREHGVATQTVLTGTPNIHHFDKPTQSGKTLWTWIQLTMRFVFTSLVDGSTFTVEAVGEGLDSSDKATNKAMTSAYKNALRIAFTLSTGDDDPDASRPQVDTPHETARNAPPNGQPGAQLDPRERAVWDAVQLAARQPAEQNTEPSRMEIANQALQMLPKCRTTGDLAAVAAWVMGKGAFQTSPTQDGTTLAMRILSTRSTLPVGPRSTPPGHWPDKREQQAGQQGVNAATMPTNTPDGY